MPGRKGIGAFEKAQHSGAVLLRLGKYFGRQKKTLSFIGFLLLVNTGSTLAGAYLLRPVINNYILTRNVSGLFRMIGWLLLIYVAGFIAGFILNRLMIVVAQKTVQSMRVDLFNRLQTLPLRYFDTHSHGDIMSTFTNDMDNVSDSLNSSITQLLTSTVTLLGTITFMLYISPTLTLVTLTLVPLMLLLASRIIKKSKGYFSAQQKELGALNGFAEEMINGEKIVRIFCHESLAEDDFEKIGYRLRDKATQAQLYSGVMMPVIQNLNTINFAVTTIVGAILALFRGLDLGGLAAFIQYSRQFGRPVNEISAQYNSVQSALAGAERIFNIMDQLPESADIPEAVDLLPSAGKVRFDEVCFGYETDRQVLKNITLEANPGQKIALVGSTGAGKSTIMNLLPRFYDIQAGKITIDGVDIRTVKRKSLRRSVAMVLQDTHLFSGSVMENIRYGRLDAKDEEVIAAASVSGAHDFITRLPLSYQTILKDDGGNLSQGQRQLLNIARATIADPAILILDEATSSVDSRTEELIQQGMDRLMKGRTCFVVAHRLSTVRNADEILVLENGGIIERGNHASLLAKKGRYFELYNVQFE